MAFIKIVNAEDGSDARYDVNAATPDERRQLDSEGRPLSADLPDQWVWTPGLPGARGGTGPGSPGGGGGGGGGGDLTASPYYQQYKSQIDAANAADLANTRSQLQQLLIQFGLVPEGFQDKYGALDDTIRALIKKNTDTGISAYARLLESKEDARRAALQNLASRGLSRSGAKGYALRRGTLDFDRAFSDSLNQILGNANSLQSGYAGRQMERQNGLAGLLAQLAASFNFGGGGRFTSPSLAPIARIAPPSIPASYSAPGYAHAGIGTPAPGGGGAIQTGGGYYTNPQTGDLTSKWEKIGTMF